MKYPVATQIFLCKQVDFHINIKKKSRKGGTTPPPFFFYLGKSFNPLMGIMVPVDCFFFSFHLLSPPTIEDIWVGSTFYWYLVNGGIRRDVSDLKQ